MILFILFLDHEFLFCLIGNINDDYRYILSLKYFNIFKSSFTIFITWLQIINF